MEKDTSSTELFEEDIGLLVGTEPEPPQVPDPEPNGGADGPEDTK